MNILIQIEHADGKVAEASLELLSLAKKLDGNIEALVCAGAHEDVIALADQLGGADAVVGVSGDSLREYNAAVYQQCLNAAIIAKQPDLVLLSYSTAGMDLAVAAASKNERDIVGYVTDLGSQGDTLAVTSQVYGGKLLAHSTLPLPGIAVVMPGAFKAEPSDATPAIESLDVNLDAADPMQVVEILVPVDEGIDLTKAERILCVGRALGGTDKLPVIEALAEKLGAEIAGSRPVIDAGWMPKARQVGKSGTKVKPKLYFMAGVSGAPEHLEGMQDSELIIALNSDEQAPIFSKAHYGAVCDLFHVVPELTERFG